MTLCFDHNTVLRDHTLKALVASLTAVADYDRCVKVVVDEGYVSFQILTLDEEAELEK
jgi:hypothetical protein